MIIDLSKRKKWRVALLLLLLPLVLIWGWTYLSAKEIRVILLDGPIDSQTSLIWQQQIHSAAKSSRIGAIVLRINSPGGNSAASEELFRSIKNVSTAGIPVVATLGDVAASGGYYIAAATNYIFANTSTLTGSIGVIMEVANLQSLYDKLGIEYQIIKGGQFKDAGHHARALTEEEKALFRGIVDETWEQFMEDVAAARQIPTGTLQTYGDGRILTGKQAVKIGLVDAIGGLTEAIDKARLLGNLSQHSRVKMVQTDTNPMSRLLNSLIGSLIRLRF